MDKESIKVLKFLKKQEEPVSRAIIIEKVGSGADKSLDYLEQINYIKEGTRLASISIDDESGRATHNYVPNSMYEITSPGLDFLQHKVGNDFDRWSSRLNVIWSIVGGALLSKPLWAAIGQIWSCLTQLIADIF